MSKLEKSVLHDKPIVMNLILKNNIDSNRVHNNIARTSDMHSEYNQFGKEVVI